MGVKISMTALAVLTWLSTISARVIDTRPQTFNSTNLNDNIAQDQQYKMILYLTPSQIRTLQQTQERQGLILPSTTSEPETLNEKDRQNYFYPNKYQQNQESNDQVQHLYSSLEKIINSYAPDEKNLDADKQKKYSTDVPVAETAYKFKDMNSFTYNQLRTVLSTEQDEKYVANKLRDSYDRSGKETNNNQQKEYTNPQTQNSAISPAILKQLQKLLQQESKYNNTQNNYNFVESDSLNESGKINSKQVYSGFKQSESNFDTLSSFEQSNNNQNRYNYTNERTFLFPKSKVQVSLSEQPDLTLSKQEPLRLALNHDHETQLLFKNKYQVIPLDNLPKERFNHKLTLEEFLDQRIPENLKTTIIHEKPQTQNMKPNKTQNAHSFNEQNLSAQSNIFLDNVKWINLESQTNAEEKSQLPPSTIHKEVISKQIPFERINSRPVSIPVWLPVPTETEHPQDNVKPSELATSLVHPENVLDKKVADNLEKHYSAIATRADGFSSLYKDVTQSNNSTNNEGVKKEKKITIINHVWTE